MKTTLPLVTAALLISPSLLADTVILVALPSELDAVRKEVRLVGQPIELAQHKISIGYRKGEKLYIARTGAGTINAAMTTQALLTRYKVDRVISIGVAGWIGEDGERKTEDRSQKTGDGGQRPEAESRTLNADSFHIGDVFIVTNVVSHQAGKETPAGFETGGKPEVRIQKSEEYQKKCEALRSNAVEIAKMIVQQPQAGTPAPPGNGSKLEANPTIREGRLVSGDSFIASTAKRTWLRETFKADAVDMVSAGIARVCEANGVPYVILRVLSDNADESASADFAAFVQRYREPLTASVAVHLVDAFAKGAAAPAK